MHLAVGIVGLGEYPHSRCFEGVAEAVRQSLAELGHEVPPALARADVVDPRRRGRTIMFGANQLADPGHDLPRDAIAFNTEQVAVDGPGDDRQFQSAAMYRDRGHAVWDYSRANVAALRALGISRAVHCPVGYHPSMARPEVRSPDVAPDVDVLFYGQLSRRRIHVLNALHRAGLSVDLIHDGIYGEALDRRIARAKVVLNLHYYERGIFEVFRVSHLLANRKCVVAESGGIDEDLEDLASATCSRAPYGSLVEACAHLARDDAAREAQAERGYDVFRRTTSMREGVRRALEAS